MQSSNTQSPDTGSGPSGAGSAELTAGLVSDPLKTLELKPHVIQALETVYDPEIPVNIYELGLIYDIDVAASGDVAIKMTLTAPGCPVAGTMPQMVRDAVARVEGLNDVDVDLVWDPPWDKSRMSEAAQLELGMY